MSLPDNWTSGESFTASAENAVEAAVNVDTDALAALHVVAANGLTGSVANPSTAPAITLGTTITGVLKGNGTAISAASAGTDFAPATTGTGLLKGDGTGGFLAAVSGTDYAPATTGTSILKANSGGFANAVAGTDYTSPSSTETQTNKTLTAPVINSPTLSNGGNVLTLPATADTLVGRATTDTLTNKSLTAPVINGTITGTYTLGGTPTLPPIPAANLPAIPAANLPDGITNFNTSQQSQVCVAGTYYYIANSGLALPASLKTGMIANQTTFIWNVALNKDSTSAGGAFKLIIYRGTTGTTTDTKDVVQTLGILTGVADQMTLKVQLTVTAVGSTGTYYWSIIPTHEAASGTGFGITTGAAGQFSGNVSSVALNTASLIFGLGFEAASATPTINIPQVQASSYNID